LIDEAEAKRTVVLVHTVDQQEDGLEMEITIKNKAMKRWGVYRLDADHYHLEDNLKKGMLIQLGFLPQKWTPE
jgi:hypothetical protein